LLEEHRATTVGNMRQNVVKIGEILVERQTEIYRRTNHNTCAHFTGVCKVMNASFVIPCFK